jgi:hypothetical protein
VTAKLMKMLQFPKKFFRLVVGDIVRDYDLDVEFRFTQDSMPVKQIFCASMKEIKQRWPEIQRLNQSGYDVIFTVVPRLRKALPGKREHALPGTAVVAGPWSDLDVGPNKPYPDWKAAMRRLFETRIRPSIIVNSGGGLHAYYLFPQPRELPQAKLEELLGGLTDRLDGDSVAAGCRRLMRVPNTLNHKYNPSRKCLVQYFSPRYTLKRLQKFARVCSNGAVRNELSTVESASEPDFFDLFSPHAEQLTRKQDEWARGICPIHGGDNPSSFSLSVRTGRWTCFSCGRQGGWREFKAAMGIAEVQTGTDTNSDLTWDTLPRFDPTAVKKTKWIVEQLIAEGTISLAYGPRGSFKSSFFLAAAGAVAAGEDFLGMATRQRRVLYLDYENPPDVIKNRDLDLHLRLPENENLVIWDRFGAQLPPRPGDPRLEEFVSHCVMKLHRKPYLIFDSWASLLRPGEGGESTGQIAPIYASIRRLCDLGATVTVLDHTRKYDKEVIYGGQDKEAKVDTIHNFVLRDQDKAVRPENPTLRITSWLKRYAPQGVGNIAVEVQSHKDANGQWHISGFKPVTDPAVEGMLKKRELLRQLIRDNPKSSQRQLATLAAAHGMGRDQAERLLKEGVGKYWAVKKVANGKLRYKVREE